MAPQRREKGTGSIYFDHMGTEHNPKGQRGDGDNTKFHRGCEGRWRGTVDLGRDGSGKRRRKPVAARTRQEVIDKMEALRQEAAIPGSDKLDKRITVGEALDSLIEYKRRRGVAEATCAADGYRVKHLKGQIGGIKLAELDAEMVEKALWKIAEFSVNSEVGRIKSVLVQAIKRQKVQGKVFHNVAADVDLPQGKKASKKRRAYTPDEIHRIREAALGWRNMDLAMTLGFLLAMRPDEIRGLHWEDVDLAPGKEAIFIVKTARRTGRTKGETDHSTGSRRGLRLPQEVVEAFKRHRVVQNQDRLKAGAQWQDTGLVITQLVGTPVPQRYFRDAFRKVLTKAGIPQKDEDGNNRVPYEMRRTWASHATDRGMQLQRAAEIMGHKTTRTLQISYKDSVRPVIEDTFDVMSAVLDEGRTNAV